MERQRTGAHGQPKRKGKIAQGKEAMQHTLTRLQLTVKQGHAGMVSRLQQSRSGVKSIGKKMVKGVTRRFGRKAPMVPEGEMLIGVDPLGVSLGVPTSSGGRPGGDGGLGGAGRDRDREVELAARVARHNASSDSGSSGDEGDSAMSHGRRGFAVVLLCCVGKLLGPL